MNISPHLREIVAVGTVMATGIAGYTGIRLDVANNEKAVSAMQLEDVKQNEAINTGRETNARIDERTRLMKEQLDRIERQVMRTK